MLFLITNSDLKVVAFLDFEYDIYISNLAILHQFAHN